MSTPSNPFESYITPETRAAMARIQASIDRYVAQPYRRPMSPYARYNRGPLQAAAEAARLRRLPEAA